MQHIYNTLVMVLLTLFISGCEVGITPLEQNFNEAGIATSAEVTKEGDIGTITIEVQEGVDIEDLNVSIELTGEDSKYFTVKMDKTAAAYIGEIEAKPDVVVYKDTTYTFFARTIVNGQRMCKKEIQKTIFKTEVAPVVENRTISVRAGSSTTFELNATDKNGDSVTFFSTSAPKQGRLSGTSPHFTYEANATASGTDSFSYVAKDEHNTSNTATVTIQISAEAIKANDDTIKTDEDIPITIRVLDNDTGATIIKSVSTPSEGKVRIKNDQTTLLYTPNKNYHGTDSFTYTNTNGDTATVNVTIEPVNVAPIADNLDVKAIEDKNVTISLSGHDPDKNATLTYVIVSPPTNGITSELIEDEITYVPNPDYNGTDSFTYKVIDEYNASSEEASVNIILEDTPDNKAPLAHDVNISIEYNDYDVEIDLNGTDVDSDVLTYSIKKNASYGAFVLDSNTSKKGTYTRKQGYTGSDSFTYRVYDGSKYSNRATVYINALEPNNKPKVQDINASGTVDISINGTDSDNDSLSYRTVVKPSFGTVSVSGDTVTYTPNTGYTGNDSFTYVANDGKDDSNEALVYVTVGSSSLGNKVLFTWNDDSSGKEVWSTDGTPDDTALLKDIHKNGDASPHSFVKVGDTYFFTATNELNGTELWKSQGTEASTVLVKDIKTNGDNNANPHNLININGTLFFAATDNTNGLELWKSDGTTLGTTLVKNINPTGSSAPKEMTNVNGTLYFTANNGTNGTELWRSDGTKDGTNNVNDINHGTDSSEPKNLTNIDGILWFTAYTHIENKVAIGRQLWAYDTTIGDEESSYTNRKFFEKLEGFNPENLFNYNGKLVFSAYTKILGRELWEGDYDDSISMVENYAMLGNPANSNPHNFTVVGDRLYFNATETMNGDNLRYWDGITKKPIRTVFLQSNHRIPNPKTIAIGEKLFYATKSEDSIDFGDVTGDDAKLLSSENNLDEVYLYQLIDGNKILYRTTATDGTETLRIYDYSNPDSPTPTVLKTGLFLNGLLP